MIEVHSENTERKEKYTDIVDYAFNFVEKTQLLKPELWRRFVDQFRSDADFDGGWRGEYWGKMMRGASLVYQYSQNEELYEILKNTVKDMIDSADENGRISSYATCHEFQAWDLWSRKYVLLGMEYFLEICKDDELRDSVIDSMREQLDYIISKIGSGEGKTPITSATGNWRGLNSSSILEPVARLYNLTGENRYFEFAEYIVETGCIDIENIFELAYENKLYPYQYPVTKAYEMISCFEGLIEFYKITKEEKYRMAITNFADKILESDFTIIGCCGCTEELFDHSTVRQANTTNGEIMQETCVTVTLMKFLYRVHILTGDPKYADAFEISFYNAYLGTLNTENVVGPTIKNRHPDWSMEPLPFDSYSPLVAGTRGNEVGGCKVMSDNHYYGCCACIGSAGIGLFPKMHLLSSNKGLVLNLFPDGVVSGITPEKNRVIFNIKTQYPKYGKVEISVKIDAPENFELAIRNPRWSANTKVLVNGDLSETKKGYIRIDRLWKDRDTIEIEFDMSTKAVHPIAYGSQVLMNKVAWEHDVVVPNYDEEDPLAHKHMALRRGPIILAQENRLGYSVDEPANIKVNDDGIVDVVLPEKGTAPYENIVEVAVPLANGKYMALTDYSSAGKLWNEESKMAAWILTE